MLFKKGFISLATLQDRQRRQSYIDSLNVYGKVSKVRKVAGVALCSMSFIVPDLSIGLISGLYVMGYNPRIIIKTKWMGVKKWWRVQRIKIK